MRRVALRVVPFLMVCYFVSFLDRVNLGFGGGIFFVSGSFALALVPLVALAAAAALAILVMGRANPFVAAIRVAR